MKTIPLTQGKIATVDDSDFDRVSIFKWTAHKRISSIGIVWHARRSVYKDGKRKRQGMHSFILGTCNLIDHKDLDGLNNTRSNLRKATSSQNRMNTKPWHHTSKFKGVSWDLPSKKWIACIYRHGKRFFLGRFLDEIDAAMAYDAAALNLFGEFALTNKQLELYDNN